MYPFCRLKLVVETFNTELKTQFNLNLVKVPKVVKPTNKKRYCKTMRTSVINSRLSPLSLIVDTHCSKALLFNIKSKR